MLELHSSDTTNEVENVNTTPADSLESPTPQLTPEPYAPTAPPTTAEDTTQNPPTSQDPWWSWFLVAIGSACLVAVATPVIWLWSKLIRSRRAKERAKALARESINKQERGLGDLVSFSNAPLLPHGQGSMVNAETLPVSTMPRRAVAIRLAPRELATAVPSRPELEEPAAFAPDAAPTTPIASECPPPQAPVVAHTPPSSVSAVHSHVPPTLLPAPAPPIASECPPPQAPVVAHTPSPVSAVHSHVPPTLLPAPDHIPSSPPQASVVAPPVHVIHLPTPTASPTSRPPLHSPNSLMRLVAQGRYSASYTPVISPIPRATPAPPNDDKKPLLGDDQPASE